MNVRFGSKAEIGVRLRNVCFTPKSGHRNSVAECPLSAKSRHSPQVLSPRDISGIDSSARRADVVSLTVPTIGPLIADHTFS
jgi:hypothetical protein